MNKFKLKQLHGKSKSKQPTLRQLIMDMRKDLDNIVKLNNLRTE